MWKEEGSSPLLSHMRNATHGFGSNKQGRAPLVNTLLAHHTGELPHDLALLGCLYLLDVLTQPDMVRGALYHQGRA